MLLDRIVEELNAQARAALLRAGIAPDMELRGWGYPVIARERPVASDGQGNALTPEDTTPLNTYFINNGSTFTDRSTRRGRVPRYTQTHSLVLIGYAVDHRALEVINAVFLRRLDVRVLSAVTDPVKVNSLYLQLEKVPDHNGRLLFAIALEIRVPDVACEVPPAQA